MFNAARFGSALAILLASAFCLNAQSAFTIRDGKIAYRGRDGSAEQIRIKQKCTDLWVAPTNDIIAFISIDKSMPPGKNIFGYVEDALPEQTSVYVARRSNGFAPELVFSTRIKIAGLVWQVFRNPSLSPNRQILYFSIPYTMTTSKLFSFRLDSRQFRVVGDITSYCTIWRGRYSGDQLLQKRRLPSDPNEGIIYACYLRTKVGGIAKVKERCEGFERFADLWTAAQGGSCTFWSQ